MSLEIKGEKWIPKRRKTIRRKFGQAREILGTLRNPYLLLGSNKNITWDTSNIIETQHCYLNTRKVSTVTTGSSRNCSFLQQVQGNVEGHDFTCPSYQINPFLYFFGTEENRQDGGYNSGILALRESTLTKEELQDNIAFQCIYIYIFMCVCNTNIVYIIYIMRVIHSL